MFCQKCGALLHEGASFCSKCGSSLSKENIINKKKEYDDELLYEIKSHFNLYYILFPYIILYLLLFFACMLLYGSINFYAGFIISIVILVVVLFVLGVKLIITKKHYKKACYKFYKTKIVYGDIFLNYVDKEIKYINIREIFMRQSYLQRFFNIGNIVLYTSADSGYVNGIVINDVKDVMDVYNNLKKIIES